MKRLNVVVACTICLAAGLGAGLWAGQASGIDAMRGKPPKEAALAALATAEKLAGKGSWERIAVGRVYYLSGEKAKGQAIFDAVTGEGPQASDWQRIGEVYAEAGEKEKAGACFDKVFVKNKRDDVGLSEVGAWYIRMGEREKGEELIRQALAINAKEVWHYVRAAEAYVGIMSR